MYGAGNDCYFWEPLIPFEASDSLTSDPVGALKDNDKIGLQLCVDDLEEDVDMSTGVNSVVAATDTYTFANFDFTGLVGAVIHISNAANPANDGDFTVTNVTSAHVVRCTGATGTADETFGTDVVVSVTYPQLEGDWTIETSNDWTPDSTGGSYDQPPNVEGHWSDITSGFRPAIASVDTGTASSYSQACVISCSFRALRFSFTATAGFGFPLVIGQMRAYS